MNKGLNRAIRVWMFLGFAFLYIPILVIILMSFNGTPYGMFPFDFTFKWYPYLFTQSELLPATMLSLRFSLLVALTAVVFGTMCAFGMQYMSPRLANTLNELLQLPITIPWLVQGVSLLLILNLLGVGRSYFGMFCGNLICVLPYVVMLVLICFNSFCIQYYLAPFGVRTLPVEVFTLIRTGYKADLNALATLMILLSLLVILLLNRMGYSSASLFAPGARKGKK